MVRPLAHLLGVALGCALLLGLTHGLTAKRIGQNEKAHFWREVNELTGVAAPVNDVAWRNDVLPLCNGLVLARGVTRGYGGPIHLLAALQLYAPRPDTDQHRVVIDGVRVTRHQETPGIADFISRPDGPWLAQLDSLEAGALIRVDTMSGATITSQAILRGLGALVAKPDLTDAWCPP